MKKKRIMLTIIVALVLTAGASATEISDITSSGPDWRGQDGTTSQFWLFNTDQRFNIAPDGPVSPSSPQPGSLGYLPDTKVVEVSSHWIETMEADDSRRRGVWALSGEIEVLVDNFDRPNDWKLMHVSLIWKPQDCDDVPIFECLEPRPAHNYPPRLLGDPVQLGCGWMKSTYVWRYPSNPEWEKFIISGNIYVDALAVDTWCVPEPATIAMLGLGGMFLARRKRS